ncbi:unnamed protein product [Colias eurytheme]|nr:unnamed protein product [Colias eurytheme]
MLKLILIFLIYSLAVCAASPTDRIIRKLDSGYRYQYAEDSDGKLHLVDLWMPITDLAAVARFNPQTSNVYHLFTRSNPSRSQPLQFNNVNLLQQSNYNSSKRTIVLIHGWMNSATSDFNMALIPVILAAADVNVIVVDWSSGANSINYRIVNWNSVTSGQAVARFIDWVNDLTGSNPGQYHIIGHGVGGHQAGVVGRNVRGQINYVTGLDPALIGWVNNIDRFAPNDALYTEVIHTNYGVNGYLADLAQVDFYPNGGIPCLAATRMNATMPEVSFTSPNQ